MSLKGGDVMNNHDFGKFICSLRKEKGLTQKELGERLNLTDKAISRWENGKSYPDIEMLELLAEELDVSINELITCKRIENQKEAEIETAKAFLVNEKTIKISKRVIAIILSLLIVIISALSACCIYGFEDNNYELSDVVVTGNLLNLNVVTQNKVTSTRLDENDGVVTLNVRTTPALKNNGSAKQVYLTAKENITKIQSQNGRVFWENGEDISKKINDIYNAKTKYIGNSSDINNLLYAIDFFEELKCKDYTIHLVTDDNPYGLEIYDITPKAELFTTVSADTYEQKIKSIAFILLACVENLDFVQFEYTLPNGVEKEYRLTVDEANKYLYIINEEEESIKDYANSHYSLKLLIEVAGRELANSDSLKYQPYLEVTQEIIDKLNNNPIDQRYIEIKNNTPYFDIHDEAENYYKWANAYKKQYKYLYNKLLEYANSEKVEHYEKEELIKAIKSIEDYSKYSEKIADMYLRAEDEIAGFRSGRDSTYCYIYFNEVRQTTLHLAEIAYYMDVDFEWLI